MDQKKPVLMAMPDRQADAVDPAHKQAMLKLLASLTERVQAGDIASLSVTVEQADGSVEAFRTPTAAPHLHALAGITNGLQALGFQYNCRTEAVL